MCVSMFFFLLLQIQERRGTLKRKTMILRLLQSVSLSVTWTTPFYLRSFTSRLHHRLPRSTRPALPFNPPCPKVSNSFSHSAAKQCTQTIQHTHTLLYVHYIYTYTYNLPYSWKFSRVPIFMDWSTQRVFAVSLLWIAEYLSHTQ